MDPKETFIDYLASYGGTLTPSVRLMAAAAMAGDEDDDAAEVQRERVLIAARKAK